MSISELISAMKSLQSRLLGTDMEISPNSFISLLNSRLPEEYLPTIDRVLAESDMTTDRLVEAILQKEQAVRERKDDVTGSNTAGASTTALLADLSYSNPSRGRARGHRRGYSGMRGRFQNNNYRGRVSRRQEPSHGMVCNYCAKRGHREENCYTKQRAERRRRSFNTPVRRNFQQSSSSQNSGNEAEQALMASYISENALMVITANKPFAKDKWIIDSGASDNLTPNRRAFRTLKSLPAPIPVFIGDGSKLYGIARGTVQIRLESGAVLEFEALYVPKLRYSLVSVACLCQKYTITFLPTTCQIMGKAKSPNQLGVLRDGLWWLSGSLITIQTLHAALVRSGSSISRPSWNLWHSRLAHLNFHSMKIALGDSLPKATELEEHELVACTVCMQAKQQRKIIHQPVARTTGPFELIHSDLAGPIATPSCSGARYFILYIDDHTRYTSVYFLRTKEAMEITGCFQEFITRIEKHFPQYPVTRFRCDNGRGEYSNKFFRGILRASGVLFEPAPPYTQHKNGLSERMIRTIATKGRSLLLDSKLDPELWAEAINTATYLHARSPSRVIGNKSPYEALYGDKPLLSHIRHFGCLAFKLVPEAQRTERKFGSRSKKCAMLGYVHDTSKIWKLWDIEQRRPFHSSDVIFDEASVAGSFEHCTGNDILKPLLPEDILLVDENEEDPVDYHDINMGCTKSPIEQSETVSTLEESARLPERLIENMGCTESPICASPVVDHETQHTPVAERVRMQPTPAVCLDSRPAPVPPQTPVAVPLLRRSGRIKSRVTQVALADGVRSARDDYKGSHGEDPAFYADAAGDEHWRAAMRSEYKSLLDNKTWTPAMLTSSTVPILSCKWVYRTKVEADDSIRHRARLVVRGFEQVEHGETFAPVARLTTVRMLLAVSALKNWKVHHMDVTTAFLNPSIGDEIVYIRPPEGFEWLDPDLYSQEGSRVLRLKKALYGLKEAPRLWFRDIDAYLHSIGFKSSMSDSNLYLSPAIILVLYVDDVLLASSSISELQRVKKMLLLKYKMKDLGLVRQFLGLEVYQSSGRIQVSQEKFITTILRRFGLENCNGLFTPMDPKQLRPTPGEDNQQLSTEDQHLYQSMVGSIMYAMTGTRPDLAYAISVLSKHLASPQRNHLAIAKRVLRYLKQTKDLHLSYSRSENSRSTTPYGFTDADWAGDTGDRKSTGGYTFLLANAAVSWKSKKQNIVALSSTEAEYISKNITLHSVRPVHLTHRTLECQLRIRTQPYYHRMHQTQPDATCNTQDATRRSTKSSRYRRLAKGPPFTLP